MSCGGGGGNLMVNFCNVFGRTAHYISGTSETFRTRKSFVFPDRDSNGLQTRKAVNCLPDNKNTHLLRYSVFRVYNGDVTEWLWGMKRYIPLSAFRNSAWPYTEILPLIYLSNMTLIFLLQWAHVLLPYKKELVTLLATH